MIGRPLQNLIISKRFLKGIDKWKGNINMATITEVFEKLTNADSTTLKTDNLSIEKNVISTKDERIQIHNISMIARSELSIPITIRDICILTITFICIFIPYSIIRIVGMGAFILYGYFVIQKYQDYIDSKYFITFNLGSSKNYRLFFKNEGFRDEVFQIVTKYFDNSINRPLSINLKNEKVIREQNIFNDKSSQTKVTQDYSQTVNASGNAAASINGNATTTGDTISNSNIAKNNSQINGSENDMPWETINNDIQKVINDGMLADNVLEVFKELLKASEEKNKANFEDIIKKNENIFNKSFVRDVFSGTTVSIIASLINIIQ